MTPKDKQALAEKIVKVNWIDSRVTDLYQVGEDELPGICQIASVGFVVEENILFITLAREKIDSEWRGVITIPKVCITGEYEMKSNEEIDKYEYD